jgi:2-iminobutanoate/2-iminopropanoate deaminase
MRNSRKLWLLCALLSVPMSLVTAQDKASELGLPFSDAVRTGNLLILSGQLGNLPGTRSLAPGGMAGQARQAMENIKAIVETHGLSMADIVKCTVMLADMNDWAAFNDVYLAYFPGRKPARSAFGAAGLAYGAQLEIECWAEFKSAQ